MERKEIVIFLTPLMGHVTPAIGLVNIMLSLNKQIGFTIFVPKLMSTDCKSISMIESFMRMATSCDRFSFHILPLPEGMQNLDHSDRLMISNRLKDLQKSSVREIVSKIKGLYGIIVDAGNAPMIDVAHEIGVPSYVFFASGAAFLGLLNYFQANKDSKKRELSDFLNSQNEFSCPSFSNPIPLSVLPSSINYLVDFVQGFRKAKGILVNSFVDLEPNAFDSFSFSSHLYDGNLKMPPVYPVGPIINQIRNGFSEEDSEILDWLNDQNPCSVVFFCFGSKGSLNLDQTKEIANGLEASGHSYLWSLRQQPDKAFFDGTWKTGKIVGWVPQLAVLSHPAIGGFVSHCGWNSTLESIWCAVPIATWPLQGDQQMNAFLVVKELGIGVEITMDYDEKRENQEIVKAKKIKEGIEKLMDDTNEERRRRLKELSRKSKEAMDEGGSSFLSLQRLLQSVTSN